MGSDDGADQPTTVEELLDRVDTSWAWFRDLVEMARGRGVQSRTNAGWTIGAMLAHVAAWHDATAYRLHRYAAAGRPQPKVEEDDDSFNARIAEEAAGLADDRIIANLDASFSRFRTAVEALSPAQLTTDDGWARAVVAGNSYDHYPEHGAELEAVPTDGR
jgi:Mycothiol maleylpyruvate isomerase N-terminal domain